MDTDGSETEGQLPDYMADELFAEEEAEGSDEELAAHTAPAFQEGSLLGRAQLDHLDSCGFPAEAVPETEVALEEDNGNMSEDTEDSSDAEEDVPEPVPTRRRLRGKQAAPEYGLPPAVQVEGQLQPAAARARDSLPVIKRPSMLKRPAGRGPKPNRSCQGYEGAACKFCPAEPGKPARVQPTRGVRNCVFCHKERMEAAHGVVRRNVLTEAVKKFFHADQGIFEAALQRIQLFLGEEAAKHYEKKAGGAARPESGWKEVLGHRQLVGRPLARKQQNEYTAAVRRDQRVARRKLFFPEKLMARASDEVENQEKAMMEELCGPVGNVASNDTNLPRPTTAQGRMLEDYCKFGSWGMCEKCSSLCPRPLCPMDLRRVNKPKVPANQCTACKHGEYVPQPEDVPPPLRNLKPKVLEALRPLEMDLGNLERVPNGYRVHTAMIAFAWKEQDVATAVEALLKHKDRKAGRDALDFLLESQDSMYKDIVEKHTEFLDKHGAFADLKLRKRPLRFIETEGLECSLWPQLYWHRNLCETVARASHESRRKPVASKRRVGDSSDEEAAAEGSEDQEDAQEKPEILVAEQGRIKRGFLRKVLSPVVGYGSEYPLLHFVYDLSLWTTIGTKKNLAARTNVALRHLLKGASWTPEYWRVRHQAVLDMQRQCGHASLFRTRAPFERTFPYHVWVMEEQAALGRPRQHLAGAETLHMAHILLQLDKGFICGDKAWTSRAGRTWKEHLFSPVDPKETSKTVLAHVTRLEFQDGKRKPASQRYHGRGTVHSHSLDFLQHVERIGLEHKLAATIPDKEREPLLHAIVLDSQQDYKDSKLPIRNAPSAWNPDTEMVELQHRQEDKDAHIRAYFKSTMEVTKCHEDVQQGVAESGRRNGAILRYVATYDMKFSSSIHTEWLQGEGSDYSVAVGVLRRMRVLEPEMWLTLAQERFPQANLSGSVVDIMTPTLNAEVKPKLVEHYEQCAWRGEEMTFLEFLRKSNNQGEIIRYIQEDHKQKVMQEVQALTGQDDKAFATTRRTLLGAWSKHKKERKREGEEALSLTDFLDQHYDHVDLTSLEHFAKAYTTRGQKLIAASTYSMLNDKYYGQWLVLHRPFRALEAFAAGAPDIMAKVNVKYRNFALCLRYAPAFWENEAAIQEAMELEAHNTAFVETILSKVRAQRFIVQKYLNEEIPVEEAVESSPESGEEAVRADGQVEKQKLTQSQKRLAKAMSKQMGQSMRAAQVHTEEELEACVAQAQGHKILFASGPPGTGKSHVLHEQVRRWKRAGARILFALPTGQLASEVRAIHPDVDVDTYHAAFLLHRPLQEAAAILTQYDLVVIDEVRRGGALHMWQS